MRCLLLVCAATLGLLPLNAEEEACYSGAGLPSLDDDEEALRMLQRVAVKGQRSLGGPEPPATRHSERPSQVLSAAESDAKKSTEPHAIAKGVKAVKALQVARSAADREQWPDIERMIHSVSSVVAESAGQLSSTVELTFSTLEGLADQLVEECAAEKKSLLQSVNATSGSVEERLSAFERRANGTLGVYLRHFLSLSEELRVSTTVMQTALTTLGNADMASRIDATLVGVSGWADTCVAAVGNVSDALTGVGRQSKDAALRRIHRLNLTLDSLLDRATLFAASLEGATANVTAGLVAAVSSRLPAPAAAAVSKTLSRVRDMAAASGKKIVLATREVTSGIQEASASTGVVDARGSGIRPGVGFAFLVTAALLHVGVS
mmetsp:Transcript_73547/g.227141  ORF Transcript_73547/g.227141 Transcript_73547/m.227141 type:complete len:378 (-) Transcript_73547:108-1241(-)